LDKKTRALRIPHLKYQLSTSLHKESKILTNKNSPLLLKTYNKLLYTNISRFRKKFLKNSVGHVHEAGVDGKKNY
jgi:hypothetical protein